MIVAAPAAVWKIDTVEEQYLGVIYRAVSDDNDGSNLLIPSLRRANYTRHVVKWMRTKRFLSSHYKTNEFFSFFFLTFMSTTTDVPFAHIVIAVAVGNLKTG